MQSVEETNTGQLADHSANDMDPENAYLRGGEWATEINTTMPCGEISTLVDPQMNLKTVFRSSKLPELINDCGASIAAVGSCWLDAWHKWGGPAERLILDKSRKQFRFGNNCLRPSLGSTVAHGWI